VDAAPHTVPYRRIGTILVEKQLITQGQLDLGLGEQQQTGRPLGEICVERFGLDRLSLADALAEQWEEMQHLNAADGVVEAEPESPVEDEVLVDHASSEDDLRALLSEAEAARAELASKTDELSRRLAALETLVVGVTDALAELRPRPRETKAADEETQTGARPRRARTGKRPAASRAASA
jgi:hypothetical protein